MNSRCRKGVGGRLRHDIRADLRGDVGSGGDNVLHDTFLWLGWRHGKAPGDSHRSPRTVAAMDIARIG
jgi:hypothetical protein